MLRGLLSASSLCVLCLAISLPVTAQPMHTVSHTYEAGGVSIVIPVPWSGMVEVGVEKRPFMDQFVPPSNRLIAGFVPSADLPKLQATGIKAPPRIGLIAVSREFESSNITPDGFKSIIESVSKNFDTTTSDFAKENEETFNQRVRALGLDNPKITFAQPVSLGCLFSSPDATGFGTILKASASASSTEPVSRTSLTKALSVLYIRVKNRILFAYVFADYKDKDTVLWLRKTSEDWCNNILNANKE